MVRAPLLNRAQNLLYRTRNSLARMVSANEVFAEPVQVAKLNFYDEGEEGQAVKGVQTEEFWMNPPYGRPRNIDYITLKQFEKSEWVQICTDCIVDGVVGAEWHIVPRDEDEEMTENEPLLDSAKEMEFWLRNFPTEESFEYCIGAMLPDLLWYDAGAIIKTFPVTNFDDSGRVINPSKVIDLSVLDGRSFMIESSVIGGRRRRYWQYSWLTPGSIPTSFELDEVMYFIMRPSSRGVYGTSKLEIISKVVNYLSDAIESNSRYLENGMFAGGQIDHPDIKNVEELNKRAKMYKAQLQGPKKSGKMLITGGGVNMKMFPFNNQQMQWLDGQKWYAKIVMAIFKVSPSEIGFTEDLNRATGIQQMNIHKSKAIRPHLDLIERTINRDLIWKINPKLKFQYSDSLDLDDKLKQAQVDKIYLEDGAITINEIRQREGRTEFEDEKFNEPFASGMGGEEEEEEETEYGFFDEGEFDEDRFEDDQDEAVTEKFIKGGPGSGIKGHTTFEAVKGKVKILDEETFYHLTNNPNFKIKTGFETEGQEFGTGLYAAAEKDVKEWDRSLGGREHIVPIITKGLKVIREEDMPSVRDMSKELMKAGYTGDKIKAAMPKGETFNRNAMEVTVKREWSKLVGIDAIIPIKDRKEAEQLIILDPSKVKFGPSKTILEHYKEKGMMKALNVEAISGQPGYTTIPEVVDGHIKTTKLEEEGIRDLSKFYEELEKKLLKQIKEIYGED